MLVTKNPRYELQVENLKRPMSCSMIINMTGEGKSHRLLICDVHSAYSDSTLQKTQGKPQYRQLSDRELCEEIFQVFYHVFKIFATNNALFASNYV